MNTISMLAHVGLYSGLALALIGRMSSASIYDKHLGEAIHTICAMQALNLSVSMNSDPVSGVDGRVATSTMDHYNTQYRVSQSDISVFAVDVSPGNSLDSVGK